MPTAAAAPISIACDYTPMIREHVLAALAARRETAEVDVYLPFVRLSRTVRAPNGRTGIIHATFRFDGDLVLLRGFGQAADSIAVQAGMARHQGLEVL